MNHHLGQDTFQFLFTSDADSLETDIFEVNYTVLNGNQSGMRYGSGGRTQVVSLHDNVLFFLIGVIVIVVNTMVMMSIYQVKHAKEYYFIAGLSIGALIVGLGYVTSSIRVFYVSLVEFYEIPRWKCLAFGIHLMMYDVGEHVCALFFLLVTVDRFLSIVFVRIYYRITESKVKVLVWMTYAFAVTWYLSVAIWSSTSSRGKKLVTAYCRGAESLSRLYGNIFNTFLLFIYYTTVALYFALLVILHSKSTSEMSAIQKIRSKRHRIVLKRISMFIMAAMCTHIVPMTMFCISSWFPSLGLYSLFDKKIRVVLLNRCRHFRASSSGVIANTKVLLLFYTGFVHQKSST